MEQWRDGAITKWDATIVNTPDLREQCAAQLLQNQSRVSQLTAFVGLDGFVDETSPCRGQTGERRQIPSPSTIAQLAARLSAAAAEAPISNSSASSPNSVAMGPSWQRSRQPRFESHLYRNLGYPNLHPVFADFAKRAEVYSIAEPGYTDALEFEDGKIMLGKHQSLRQVNWENIKTRFGLEKFTSTSARRPISSAVSMVQ